MIQLQKHGRPVGVTEPSSFLGLECHLRGGAEEDDRRMLLSSHSHSPVELQTQEEKTLEDDRQTVRGPPTTSLFQIQIEAEETAVGVGEHQEQTCSLKTHRVFWFRMVEKKQKNWNTESELLPPRSTAAEEDRRTDGATKIEVRSFDGLILVTDSWTEKYLRKHH